MCQTLTPVSWYVDWVVIKVHDTMCVHTKVIFSKQ